MKEVRIIIFTGLTILLINALGCTTSSSDDGARYFEFTHQDKDIEYTFIAKTSDPEVIAKVEGELAKPFDKRSLHINGDIARGNDGYNTNWSWHFIPGEWDMASISTEVCDGRPSMVEEDLEYWVDQLGYFCPWSSRVLQEVEPSRIESKG